MAVVPYIAHCYVPKDDADGWFFVDVGQEFVVLDVRNRTRTSDGRSGWSEYVVLDGSGAVVVLAIPPPDVGKRKSTFVRLAPVRARRSG